MTSSRPAPRPWILLFIAVVLIAANMRMTISGVGPLLDEIAADQGVPTSALGALGSVPLIAWALCSPLGHWLSARLGMANAVTAALIVLTAGTIWRSIPAAPLNLWFGTALIGVGLAIANVLMPAIIRREFPNRITLVMGVYTSLLSGMAAVSAGIVVPLSHTQGPQGELGWRIALLCTGVPLIPALIVWLISHLRGSRAPRPHETHTVRGPAATPHDAAVQAASAAAAAADAQDHRAGRRIWGDGIAWLVSIYMGSQSTIFFVISTWLAPYRVAHGESPVAAGLELMVFQLCGIAGSMIMPLIMRGRLTRVLPAVLGVGNVVTVLGMVYLPSLMLVWVTAGGAFSGAALTMALMLIAQKARTHAHSTALSGMAQSAGYAVAALGPVAFGWLQGLSGSWTLPFVVVWITGAAQIFAGLVLGRPSFVLEARTRDREPTANTP